MKKILVGILLSYLVVFSGIVSAEDNKKITHVVMVWLNKPGNEQQRTEFIKASKELSSLPGIVNRHVGIVLPSDRKIVDDTFDVAVTVTLKNKAALKAYLNDPKHKKVLHEKIKPLVNRTVVYDFISQ
jgi:type III secretory pathway lipoprotein EscJ